MNIATQWQEERLEDGRVRYVSEHTVGGRIVVTASVKDGTIEWDNPNDVPVFIAERAAKTLGV